MDDCETVKGSKLAESTPLPPTRAVVRGLERSEAQRDEVLFPCAVRSELVAVDLTSPLQDVIKHKT